ITDPLDISRDGGNATQLGRNSARRGLTYHSQTYLDYSCASVVLTDRIQRIANDDIDALRAARADFKGSSGWRLLTPFKQVFRDSFFHADMHPGNIFVDVTRPHRPLYLGVDFGIVGTLTPQDQRYLAENFLAFFNRDYRRIAELHIESGWMPADTRIEE